MFWGLTRLIAENTRQIQKTLETAGDKTALFGRGSGDPDGALLFQVRGYIQRYAVAIPSDLLMRYV
jgi:hypothetical protein